VESTWLSAIGIVGLASLIAADLLLVWTPERNLDPFRAAEGKSDRRVITGALLGVIAIPFVLAGIASLWVALAPAPWWLSVPPLILAAFAYVIGAGFHAAIGFYVVAIRETPAGERAGSAMLKAMARMFRPLRSLLWMSIFASCIWLFAAIASGDTQYPKWVAAISPLPCVLLFRVLGRVGPPAVAGALTPAGGNLAVLIFLIVSRVVLPHAGST
jgi:hypothetical protein